MSLPRFSLILILVGLFGMFGLQTPSQPQAPTKDRPNVNPEPPQPRAAGAAVQAPANEIVQEFPTKETPKTAWKIQWATTNMEGFFRIKNAWFRRAPGEPFIQVLGDVRLAEMFVPYQSGTPRFWDMSIKEFDLLNVGHVEAGPFGKVLGNPPKVVAELRDRGVMWADPDSGVRRGQALILWAMLDAANYRYLIEFGFQDDGVFTARVGATGRNFATREFEGHMHNGLWRVDVNVDGPANNSVYVMEHVETANPSPGEARTESRLFNRGKEGFEDWQALKFTMLNVLNHQRKNERGKPLSYDFIVPRTGAARHFGPGEGCTQHDFWVTKNRRGETNYRNIADYVNNGESILSTDVVVWLSNACHHHPRSEDGKIRDDKLQGTTHVAWSGFELRPRNFFNGTPHFEYQSPPAK